MIIPGMVSATFKTRTPEDVLSVLRKAGLAAIEWSENWHIPPGDPGAAACLREKTLAQGAEIAAYGSYYRLGQSTNPEREFWPSLQNAAAMHAPLIRIWGGATPSAELSADDRAALAREAGTVSAMAADLGVKVALEWHKNTVTDTNVSAARFLEEANAENLYCLWQPTVALSLDERCAGLDLLTQRGRLLNLHVYYWKEGKRRPFAEGCAQWERYLQHVDPAQTRYGLLEFVMGDSEEQFLADARQWKQLLNNTHHR